MIIKTSRLLIRHIKSNDWKSLKGIWEDFNKSNYAVYDKPHSTEDFDIRLKIEKWANACKGMDHLFFAICLSDEVIGYVAFNRRENGYEVGYCFHSAYHNRGYAKESLMALLSYIKDVGAKRITAGTALNNYPSVKLLEAAGFHLIGKEKVSFYKDAYGDDIVFDGGIFELLLK